MSILVNGELVLYGFVGESFWNEGFTSREVVDALAEHGRDNDITVRINSGGGYVDDGVAIFNALTNHKGKVTVIVDALAASSASVIAMAGEERIMRKGAMIMIHDPSSVVWGTAEDMAKAVRMLEKHADNIAGIYADVTGEDVEDLRSDMREETWLSADDAVERGFATASSDKKAKAAAAHDYSVYARAPDRLLNLTKSKNWSHERPTAKASASAKASNRRTPTEDKMTDKTGADNQTADTEKALADATSKASADTKARIKAIMTHDEAKGRETLAEYFAYETEMSVDAVAAALKAAPKAAAEGEGKQPVASYEEKRLASAGLSQPGGKDERKPSANLNPSAIYNKRREAAKGA